MDYLDINSAPETVEVVDLSFLFTNGHLESYTLRPTEGDGMQLDPETHLVVIRLARQNLTITINLSNTLFSSQQKRQEKVRPEPKAK